MIVNSIFMKVWLSRFISILGTSLTSFGISVWVYSATGKATPMAITLLCSILPSILMAPLSGILCDRYNRKIIILIADTCAAGISLLLLIFILFLKLNFGIICLFVFLISVANSFDTNAYQASTTTLVSMEEIKKANGLNQIIDSISNILSPVIAGVLYSVIGLHGIIMVDLASYVLSMMIFVRMPAESFSKSQVIERKKKKGKAKGTWRGFQFIISQKSLFLLLIYFTILNFFFNLATSLIEPFSLNVGNSVDLGLVKACGGTGILCGSLFVTTYKFKRPSYQIIGLAAGMTGISLCLMGSTPRIPLIAAGRLLFSFFGPVVNTIAGTLWMEKTPQELQGRVYAARVMLAKCFLPISYLLVGPLVDVILPKILRQGGSLSKIIILLGGVAVEYRIVFLGTGLGVILVTILALLNKNFRYLY